MDVSYLVFPGAIDQKPLVAGTPSNFPVSLGFILFIKIVSRFALKTEVGIDIPSGLSRVSHYRSRRTFLASPGMKS